MKRRGGARKLQSKPKRLNAQEEEKLRKISISTFLKERWTKDEVATCDIKARIKFEPKYLSGTCLLTKVECHDTGITLDDLIHKESLQKAIISSSEIKMDWLKDYLNPEVPICFIKGFGDGDFKDVQHSASEYLEIIPPLEKFESMHVKMMLLIYPGFLRMVIGSADLVKADWSELENMVFVQDFPQRTVKNGRTKGSSSLGNDLRRFLKCLTVPDTIGDIIHSYDFSSAQVELVFSTPGKYSDEDIGLNMLGSKVCGLFPNDHVIIKGELYYQTSSLGNLAHGITDDIWSSVYPSLKTESKLKVLFPTTNTVASSHLGGPGGDSIFLHRGYFKPWFPENTLCDSISLRDGSLSHSKIIVGTAQIVKEGLSESEVKWFYCGSHNLSASAWGRNLGLNEDDQLCRKASNYELGVVGIQSLASFSAPFKFPPPPYGINDSPFDSRDPFDSGLR